VPCASAPVPQDAASSYLATRAGHGPAIPGLATFSLADLDVPGPLARAPIVDTKPPPAWLVEARPSPTVMVYHDDALVVHGGADVFPGAAAVALADTDGDPALLPSATHPST
jgi:hypothetical protein